MPEEEKENPCANFARGRKFGEWAIQEKLDEGGFGQVYKVTNNAGKVAALKAEPNDVEGGSAIKLEMYVLKSMHEGGEKAHVPVVYHAAKHKKFCYMIMMLLGENLKHLKNSSPKERMTPHTWSRIAIQCVYGMKTVHDCGYVHRDIKPNNFVMGYKDDADRARIVYILDFGLTRPYAIKKGDKWIVRRARGTAEFRGTLRYCSPNVHERKEQGRRDDLWGLIYILIEFHCGLPWQKVSDKQKVEVMKLNIEDKVLLQNMPPEMLPLPAHLRALDYYMRPDYNLFYDVFLAIQKRLKVNHWDPYDWETKAQVDEMKAKVGGKLPEWEAKASEFFKSDPIGINGPPPKEDKKKKEDTTGQQSTKPASLMEEALSKAAGTVK